MAKQIDYFVNYGPDTRHLIHTKVFARLKDAKLFVQKLNRSKAYTLIRMESPSGWSTAKTTNKILSQRII